MGSLRARTAIAAAFGGILITIPVALVAITSANTSLMGIVAALLIGGTLGASAGWVAGERSASEIDALRVLVDQANAGDLSASAGLASMREVSDLARSVNQLIGQLDAIEYRSAQERRWMEAIFDGLQDGIILVDSDEHVSAANLRSGSLLGSPQDVQIGQRLMMLARDYELVSQFREVMRNAEPSSRTVHHSLSERSIDITVLPVETEGERFGLIVLRDVTELRRLELVRREFVANVSHELKTPLASIRALADTLEAGAIDDPEVSSDFLRRIVIEVERLNALVDDLLDLGRLESNRLPLDYRTYRPIELIEQSIARLQHQIDNAGLSIAIDAPGDLRPVTLDGPRIEQVLLNLIQNAVKFTPAGGSILLRASESDSRLIVDVIDSGVGIQEDELPRLFERFYKSDRGRHSSGTGLGLAIAKHIVLAHGGTIGAESRLGLGSTFTFEVPIDPTLRASQSASTPS